MFGMAFYCQIKLFWAQRDYSLSWFKSAISPSPPKAKGVEVFTPVESSSRDLWNDLGEGRALRKGCARGKSF